MNKKTILINMLSIRDVPPNKRYTQIKNKGMEKDISCNGNKNNAWVAILVSDKINFETKAIVTVKEGHYIMIKESRQENINLVNIYAFNIGASNI